MLVSAVRSRPSSCTPHQAPRPGTSDTSKQKHHVRADGNGPQCNSLPQGSSLRRKKHGSINGKCCRARAYAGFRGRDLGVLAHGLPRNVHDSF